MDTSTSVIVGGGIAGLATAWALAERGCRKVLLLEREDQTGQHSSGRNAGILRAAIESPATRALARMTAGLLKDPPQSLVPHLRGPLLDPCGLVVSEGSPELPEPRWLRDAEQDGARPLEAAELAKLVPPFVPEGTRSWLFPHHGRIDRDGLIAALTAALGAAGVQVRTGCAVRQVSLDAQGAVRGVELASGETLPCDRVVLAPGGWAASLGLGCGARFPGRATRRHLFVSRPHSRIDPDWPVVWDDTAGFYFLPEGQGLMLCVCDGEDTDPDACIQDPLMERRLRRRLAASLPALKDLELARSWCAMRTVSEDDHPVAGEDPQVPGLWWAGALGGHGMTIGLGFGRTLASMLTGEPVDPALARLLDPASPEREYEPTRDWS